jgi:hypothetical protein
MPRAIDLYFAVDACSFVVLNPADHPRIEEDGNAFHLLDDDVDAILERGLVLGLRLGADGYKGIRVVIGPLPPEVRDEELDGAPFVFRLHVRHGRMFVSDPSYDFPTSEELGLPADDLDYVFFDVENGRYRASLHPLRSEAVEREKVLWILTLERVESFEDIPAWREFPHEESSNRIAARAPERSLVRVRHAKYGLGWADGGALEDRGAVPVRFDAHGEKKIAGAFLERVRRAGEREDA